MKIGVDIDGVLASFESSFAPLLTKLTGISFPLNNPEFPPVWHWPAHYGVSKDHEAAAWMLVKEDPRFWRLLSHYPETPDACKRLVNAQYRGHEVYFITHRFGRNAKQQTENWLQEVGMHLPTVLVAERKGFVAHGLELDMFIDDKPGNVRDVNEATNGDCTCYLLDRPYNREVTSFTRVKSVQEMLDIELEGRYPADRPVATAGETTVGY